MTDSPPSATTAADEPIVSVTDDALGFVPRYAVPLAEQIVSTSMSDSLAIGIYGPWGSGKTSLMNLIRALVSGEQKTADFVVEKPCVTVRYTAWKYAHEESLWRTLVKVVLDELLRQTDDRDEEKRRLRETLYGDVVETRRRLKINWPRLVGALVSIISIVLAIIFETRDPSVPSTVQVTLAGLALGGAAVTAFGVKWTSPLMSSAEQPSFAERLGSQATDIAQAFQIVDDVLTTHRRLQYIEQFADGFELIVRRFLKGRRLVIFVDDLDRCLPEKAVEVLEGIKLFLGVPSTVFVVGVDIAALAYAVELHYAQEYYRPDKSLRELPGFMSGTRYLEKVIQFPFHLPPMAESDMLTSPLVLQLCERKDDLRWLEIGIRGFPGNPRALKRFARIYRNRRSVIAATDYDKDLAGSRELHLAKLVVLQEHHQWGELVDLIVRYTVSAPPSLLRDGPLALLKRAASDSEERDRILSFTGTGVMSQLVRFAADDALMHFLRIDPRYDGENPVDPLPLIRLGGGSEAKLEADPEPSSLDVIMRDLRSDDLPTRAKSISAVRDMSPQSRRQLVERLLSEVAGQSHSDNPDSAGLPLTIMAIQSLIAQGIEPEPLTERSNWFTALLAETEKRSSASRSREALVSLIAEIESIVGSSPQIDEAEMVDFLEYRPATEDQLGSAKYVGAIAEAIRTSSTPLTVGIFGKWGSGKTSFMKFLEHRMEEWPEYVSVFVNAWADESENAIQLISRAISSALDTRASDLARIADPSRSETSRYLREILGEVLGRDGRLVIFIDDMDRRPPSFQVEMMEEIRSTLRLQGLVTVIAADRDILTQAAKARQGSEDAQAGEDFIDEIIDISIIVATDPSVSRTMLRDLLGTDLSDERFELLVRYLDPNPRKLKQFVNRYRLCLVVVNQAHESVDTGLLWTLTLIASRWPRLLKNVPLLVNLWRASHELNLRERSDLVKRAINEYELLDTDDLTSFFERVPPATERDVAHALALMGRVLGS